MNKALIALITIWAIIVLITVYLLSNQVKRVDSYYQEVKETLTSFLELKEPIENFRRLVKAIESKEPIVIICNFENGECFGDWEEYVGDEEFNK